jgi:hypothetical protein
MLTKGCTSAYTTWIQMIKELEEGALTYKNVGKRFVKLANHGIIEEVKLDIENIHGRKDYKITMKGFEILLSYIIGHPQDMQSIVDYVNKFDVDKHQLGLLLMKGEYNTIVTLNEYQRLTNALYYPFGITEMEEIKKWFEKYHDNVDKDRKEVQTRLNAALTVMRKNMSMGGDKIREQTKLTKALEKMMEDMISATKDQHKLDVQFDAESKRLQNKDKKKKPT